MPKYLFAYHGGDQPSSKDEGDRVMAAWNTWIGGLGAKMVDAGNPIGTARTVSPGGKVSESGGANPITGYSVVEAATMDEAVRIAKDCPQLAANGSVEVAEAYDIM